MTKIYGLDIETSPVWVNDTMYRVLSSCVICEYDFIKYNTNQEYIENRTFHLLRTYEEINQYFTQLNSETGTKVLCFVHNFAYEMDFFQSNMEIIKNAIERYNKINEYLTVQENSDLIDYKSQNAIARKCDCSYICTDNHKYLYVNIGKVEFRDSLRLFHSSIKRLGERINLRKLEYDYDDIIYSWTPLTKEQIEYNVRDVDIMMISIINRFYNNFKDNCTKIPLTSTGYIKYLSKTMKEINEEIIYTRKKDTGRKKAGEKVTSNLKQFYELECNENKFKSAKEMELAMNCFMGAYVHANSFGSFHFFSNVYSFDFGSHYPQTMASRLFPFDFEYQEGNLLEKLKIMHKQNMYYYGNCSDDSVSYFVSNNNLCRNWFLCKCTIIDVECRWFNTDVQGIKNYMPLISQSKIEYNRGDLSSIIFDNGRLIKSEVPVTIYCSSLDLISYELLYNFKIIDCTELSIAKTVRPLHKYILNQISVFASKKQELKGINGIWEETKDKDLLSTQVKESIILNENEKEEITNILLLNDDNITIQLDDLYMQSKGNLNGLYGINVQKPNREYNSFNVELGEWEHFPMTFENYQSQKATNNFYNGLFITAFTRLELAICSMIVFMNGGIVLYWDTDSNKVYFPTEESKQAVIEAIDYYNETKYETFDKPMRKGVKSITQLGIGKFEFEKIYDKFITLGSKKYVTWKNGKCSATISGLSKSIGGNIFGTLYNNYKKLGYTDEEIEKEIFLPNLLIQDTATQKLASSFNHFYVDIDVKDKNGVSGKIQEWSGMNLVPSEYNMLGTNSVANEYYFGVLRDVFDNDINSELFRTVLEECDEHGKVINYKLEPSHIRTDWSKVQKDKWLKVQHKQLVDDLVIESTAI